MPCMSLERCLPCNCVLALCFDLPWAMAGFTQSLCCSEFRSCVNQFIQHALKAGHVGADAAPEAALRALQGPVQTALQQAQDEDRPRTSAATEILAGLIGSAASFQSLSGNNRHLTSVSQLILA